MKTNYVDLEKFYAWVEKNSKSKSNDLDAWLADLENRHAETGSTSFEMHPSETKSGHAECYYYDWTFEENEEDDNLNVETYTF